MFPHAWIRGLRSCHGSAPANRRYRLFPSVERLEDRCVPSIASTLPPAAGSVNGDNTQVALTVPALTYSGQKIHLVPAAAHNHVPQTTPAGFQLVNQGGPVLANVEVESVFLGNYWNTSAGKTLAKRIDAFFTYVTSSPYVGILSRYGVNPGTFTGQTLIATSLPAGTSLDDSTLQSTLGQAISAGTLSTPDANTLYAVFTSPKVAVTLNGDSSTSGLLGYHSSFIGSDSAGSPFTANYAVIAQPIGNTPIKGLGIFQDLTAITSHELAEATTDPEPLTNPAWINPANGEEVADPGEGQFGALSGYIVQVLWSNAANAVVLPAGAVQNGITVAVGKLQATTGTDFSGTVATFQDPTGTSDPIAYQAVINWGDGTTSLGTVAVSSTASAKPGGLAKPPVKRADSTVVFTVSADHIYSTPGNFVVRVQITRTDGTTAAGKGTATVTGSTTNSNDLSAVGVDVTATAGTSFTTTVATFTDMGILLGNQNGQIGNYSATIDWGDGSTSTGTIEPGGVIVVDPPVGAPPAPQMAGRVIIRDGLRTTLDITFNVQGTHTYSDTGSYTISVTITRDDGATASASSTATVQPAQTSTITATGVNITEEVGVSFTDTVATFFDMPPVAVSASSDGTPTTYTATIDWGDGSTSTGKVLATPVAIGTNGDGTGASPMDMTSPVAGGEFVVQGTHSYSSTGSYTISVTITRDDGVTATTTSTATVVPVPTSTLTATGVNLTESAGVAFTDTVATFTDTPAVLNMLQGQTGTPHTYKAIVDWGDGSTSTGAILPLPFASNGGPVGTPPPTASAISTADSSGSITLPLPVFAYLVQGTHTYANTGSFNFTVTITRDDGVTATATSTATVNPPPTPGTLSVNAEPVTGTAGGPIVAVVATFTDSGSPGPIAVPLATAAMYTPYTATVDWGDGTTSTGVIVPNFFATAPPVTVTGTPPIGPLPPISYSFIVLGDHTYTQAGSFTITVSITGPDGENGSATSTATIAAASSGT
jgi:hypothetical protein